MQKCGGNVLFRVGCKECLYRFKYMSLSFDFSEVLMGAEISWLLIFASIGNIFWHLLNLLELYCLSLFKMVFYNYGLFCPTWGAAGFQSYIPVMLVISTWFQKRSISTPIDCVELEVLQDSRSIFQWCLSYPLDSKKDPYPLQ